MNKIYIIAPTISQKSWEQPFFIFANCISRVLTKNKLENIITLDTSLPQENDLSIVFYPYYSNNNSNKVYKLRPIKSFVIYIISESINVRKCIMEEIKNPKIKMIWDYQNHNISILKKITKTPVYFVPPLYHEFMEENYPKKKSEKTIDFLLYGQNNKRRERIFNVLKKKYNAMIYHTNKINDLYDTINKAKIILLIAFYEDVLNVDFYRISFLFSNKIFFITEETNDKVFYEKMQDYCIFTPYKDIISTCENYIKFTQDDRDRMAQNAYNNFKKNFNLEDFVPVQKIREII